MKTSAVVNGRTGSSRLFREIWVCPVLQFALVVVPAVFLLILATGCNEKKTGIK